MTHGRPVCPRIFLVDDDPAVRASLQLALEQEGFSVAVYESGEALAEGDALPAEGCLILDYRLPGMDGLTLLALLRRRAVAMPAVPITSNPKAALRKRAADAGVPIVEKPLMGNALADSVRRALFDARRGTLAQG